MGTNFWEVVVKVIEKQTDLKLKEYLTIIIKRLQIL